MPQINLKITKRDFVPLAGADKALPVYSGKYNRMVDVIGSLQTDMTGSAGVLAGVHSALTGSTNVKYDTAGDVASGLTVVESGDEVVHRTKISGTLFDTANVAGGVLTNGNKAYGAKLYDFPQGGIRVHNVVFDLLLTASLSTAKPEIAVGTVVATGAQATVGAVGNTSEDIIDGTPMATAGSTGVAAHHVAAAEADAVAFDGCTAAKDAYINFAAAWGAVGTFVVTGDVHMTWSYLGCYS